MRHEDIYTSPNESTLLFLESGKACYSCKHNRCAEGAAKGKKVFDDFRAYYDSDRTLMHQALGSEVISEDEDVPALLAARSAERAAEAESEETIAPPITEPRAAELVAELRATELRAAELRTAAKAAAAAPGRAFLGIPNFDFPEAALDCHLGEYARATEMPLGLAFPAVLTESSVLLEKDTMICTFLSLYVFLIAPVGGGKDLAMERARRVLAIPDHLLKRGSPSSSPGLMNFIGETVIKKKGGVERIPGPRKLLLLSKELKSGVKAANYDGSTLFEFLNEVWDSGQYYSPSRHDDRSCNCRMSWVGGLPIPDDDPEAFQKLLGTEGANGLLSRALLGYTRERFRFDDIGDNSEWVPKRERLREHTPVIVSGMEPEAREMWRSWDHPADKDGRHRYNLRRVAIIIAAFEGETLISVKTMRCAVAFIEWQAELRGLFKASEAENQQGEFLERLIHKLRREGAETTSVNLKSLITRHRLHRYGGQIVQFGIKAALELDLIYYEVLVDKDGKVRRDEDNQPMRSKTKVRLNPEA